MTTGSRRVATGVERGNGFHLTVDGQPMEAYPGETIATVLLAAAHRILRRTRSGEPRGVFCAMGTCHDCRMIVDGAPNVRTCVTPARAGMIVERQVGLGPSDEAAS